MPNRSIVRRATPLGFATPSNTPIYVDADDNILKMIPAGSGTTEVQVIDASSVQTLTNKTVSGADPAEVVITTNVILAAESGATFFLDLAAGFTSTLPAPAAGLRFRFVVKTAPTGAPYVINTPTANIIYGMFVERAGGVGVAGAAQDTVNLVHNQSIIGDWAEFYSDGTNWYVRGMVNVSAGVTFAVT